VHTLKKGLLAVNSQRPGYSCVGQASRAQEHRSLPSQLEGYGDCVSPTRMPEGKMKLVSCKLFLKLKNEN
jgi:hypothetical protein